MKKTLYALAFALLAGAGAASAGNVKESAVPTAVKDYVTKSYPRVAPVEWDYNERGNYYTADFKIDGNEYELDIAPTGELINSDIEIPTGKLPASIGAYLAKQYPTFQIKGAKQMTRRGVTTYEVEIKGQNSDQMLTFSESGTLLERDR